MSSPIVTEPPPTVTEPSPIVTELSPIVTEPSPIVTEPSPIITEPVRVNKVVCPIGDKSIFVYEHGYSEDERPNGIEYLEINVDSATMEITFTVYATEEWEPRNVFILFSCDRIKQAKATQDEDGVVFKITSEVQGEEKKKLFKTNAKTVEEFIQKRTAELEKLKEKISIPDHRDNQQYLIRVHEGRLMEKGEVYLDEARMIKLEIEKPDLLEYALEHNLKKCRLEDWGVCIADSHPGKLLADTLCSAEELLVYCTHDRDAYLLSENLLLLEKRMIEDRKKAEEAKKKVEEAEAKALERLRKFGREHGYR